MSKIRSPTDSTVLFPGGDGGEDIRHGQPDPGDALIIAGVTFFGVAEVKGHIKQREEKKTTPGKHGSVTTLHGWDSWEGSIVLRWWTGVQFRSYQRIKGIVRPPESKGPPEAVSVYHWALADDRVDRILVLELSTPEHVGRGEWKATWKCRQLGGSVRAAGAGSALSTPKKATHNINDLGPGAVQRKIDEERRPAVAQSSPTSSSPSWYKPPASNLPPWYKP